MVREHKLEIRHEMRGGNGDVYIYNVLGKDELNGHGRLYAKIVLPPGASIGVHEHVGETEPFYVIEGEGLFVGPDGAETPVKAGDCCLIEPGESHGMINNTDKEMAFMALIYNA